MAEKKSKIGIVGGTSLLAGYLIRYLVHHPFVELEYIDSEHNPGEPLSRFHNVFESKLKDRKLDAYSPDSIKNNLDLVFIAKPHTEAMRYVKELYNDRLRIIDLSGDFRIKNIAEYEKWYKSQHIAEDLAAKSVYGLTEIYRDEIKNALLIANPGCYPTGILLSLYPLLKRDIIKPDSVFVTSYSGVSGAGKNYVPGKNLFLDAFNNVIAYKVTDHQHIPEIEEQLTLLNRNIAVNFIPHIASMENGIFNTIFLKPKTDHSREKVMSMFEEFYAGSKFVKIFAGKPPQIKDVVNTNYCFIFPEVNKRTNTLIILSVIDNRIKGGAGQAVQNMNVMLGFEEDTGLI